MPVTTEEFRRTARALAETAQFLARQGWVPATSGNFSARVAGSQVLAVSRSGVDKHAFTSQDVIALDTEGHVLAPEGARPSAEAALHVAVYAARPEAGAVLHVHSLASTVLSARHAARGEVVFEGLEILKGLAGVTTHEARVALPIVPNSQDMESLSASFRDVLAAQPGALGLLIAGHGLYAWGPDLDEARRHVETFEFLLQCRLEQERHP